MPNDGPNQPLRLDIKASVNDNSGSDFTSSKGGQGKARAEIRAYDEEPLLPQSSPISRFGKRRQNGVPSGHDSKKVKSRRVRKPATEVVNQSQAGKPSAVMFLGGGSVTDPIDLK